MHIQLFSNVYIYISVYIVKRHTYKRSDVLRACSAPKCRELLRSGGELFLAEIVSRFLNPRRDNNERARFAPCESDGGLEREWQWVEAENADLEDAGQTTNIQVIFLVLCFGKLTKMSRYLAPMTWLVDVDESTSRWHHKVNRMQKLANARKCGRNVDLRSRCFVKNDAWIFCARAKKVNRGWFCISSF